MSRRKGPVRMLAEMIALRASCHLKDPVEATAEHREELAAMFEVAEDRIRHLEAEVARLEAAATANQDRMQRNAVLYEERMRLGLQGVAIDSLVDSFDPHGCFVYCLWGSSDDQPLYVGLSTNVLSRLGTHLTNRERRWGVQRVTLIRCIDEDEMRRTESRLIHQFQPPWNIAGIVAA